MDIKEYKVISPSTDMERILNALLAQGFNVVAATEQFIILAR